MLGRSSTAVNKGGISRRTQYDEGNDVAKLGPSEEAKKGVADCIAIIEGVDPQDRGYVLNRLAQIYFGATGAKQIKGALKNSQASKRSKTGWKKKWEASPEYQAWQDHIEVHKDDTPAERENRQAEYSVLRQCAFRVRDSLKPSTNHKGGGQVKNQVEGEEEIPLEEGTTPQD